MFLTGSATAGGVDFPQATANSCKSPRVRARPGCDERRLLRQLAALSSSQSEETLPGCPPPGGSGTSSTWFDTEYQEVIVQFARAGRAGKTLLTNRIQIKARYEQKLAQVEANLVAGRRALKDAYSREKELGKGEYKEVRWTATAVYEGIETQAEKTFRTSIQELDEVQRRVLARRESALDYLTLCKMPIPEIPPPQPAPLSPRDLKDLTSDISARGKKLEKMRSPNFFRREGVLWLFIVLWIAAAGAGFFAAGLFWGIVGGAAIALAAAFGGSAFLYSWSRAKVNQLSAPLLENVNRALQAEEALRRQATEEHRNIVRDGRSKMEQEVQRAANAYQAEERGQRAA